MPRASKQRKPGEPYAPRISALDRPDYSEADAQAIRALADFTATSEQQARAMEYIAKILCYSGSTAYRESQRMTDLVIGGQLVWDHFMHIVRTVPVKTDPDKTAARQMKESGAKDE